MHDSEDRTLWSSQVKALEKMLQFNNENDSDNLNTPVSWKVLVFDTVGRDIVSSVLRVQDLFKNGVTLHLMLHSNRSAIPDVPAIYFVEPTPENIEVIGRDLAQGLYSSTSINFTRPLTRQLLEDLAAKTLHTSNHISQVFEQYLQFMVLEPDVFSLEISDSYKQLSDPKAKESDIELNVNKIVDGLFCMLLTYGVIPVIRASRGNAAEMIAQVLDEKLRSFLVNKRGEIPPQMHEKRVVLTIVDRNIDLVSMFSHSWTYESLINDTCVFKRSSIRTPENKIYDIEPSDKFWQENRRLPFPEVADQLDQAVTKFKDDSRKITGSSDLEDPSNFDLSQTTTTLKSALTAMPELSQRKKAIDMHMDIATVLLKSIGDRGLAQLFEAEETALKQTPKSMLELIRNPELGTPEDKLRLYLVYYVSAHSPPEKQISDSDVSEIEAELTKLFEGQEDLLRALKYVKRTKEISRMSMAATSSVSNQQLNNADTSNDFFRRLTGGISDKLNQGSLSGGVGSLISGVKNFLPEKTDLPITKIAQHLIDPQTSPKSAISKVADDFLYFDPKESRGTGSKKPRVSVYDQCIMFMVGGGNYYEYASVSAKLGDKVIYGATDMPSPHAFVEQCAQLGQF